MSEDDRERAALAAVDNPHSAYYQNLVRLLNSATIGAKASKDGQPYITIPFVVEDSDLNALEEQFGVTIRSKGVSVRCRLTARVGALMFVLDAALMEHAGSGGRSVLLIDGDVVTAVFCGLEGKIVERTHCHARAAFGYFAEDEILRGMIQNEKCSKHVDAMSMWQEIRDGSGEHFSNRVRSEGFTVDSVVFNHFKTPVNLTQACWLVKGRGGVGYGAFPFQCDMRENTSGRLQCFPGWFYVDEQADVITLVPDDDASMSISHPFKQLMEFVDCNGLVVDGTEFLCEKYMGVEGILYYTIASVDQEYEAPETLRAHYFDASKLAMSKISYPEVKFSKEGVPIGFGRGSVNIYDQRMEKVLARAAISRSEIVEPVEVYGILMSENNMIVNTMDTAAVSVRLDERVQEKVAIAMALHVNWRRHAARGTLKTLLNAVKVRHKATDASVFSFAGLALSAWWSRPNVSKEVQGSIPFAHVADWCGNDFSVVISQVDPWVEIAHDTSKVVASLDKQFHWLPFVHGESKAAEQEPVVGAVVTVRDDSTLVKSTVLSKWDATRLINRVAAKGAPSVEVTTFEVHVPKGERVDMTELKRSLVSKMAGEQGAVMERNEGRLQYIIDGCVPDSIPLVRVPYVDPVSAIRADLDMMVGGLPEMDATRIGYRLAEVESDKATRGCISINDSKRLIPKPRYVRKPKVDAGVEGNRIQSSAALLGALYKRNVGIPSNRGVVDLDLMPDAVVDRVIATCFRDDWKGIVSKHIATGMWESNVQDIEDFVANAEENKVKKMLDEYFSEGTVRLDRWFLMAKGKIKAKREEGADSKVSHSQTIMYLNEASTNGMYSAMTRRFNSCFSECLRENIKVNPQWGPEESEDWYNTIEPIRRSVGRTYSYSVDSSDYDRSQEHPCLLFEMAFYRRMGLNQDTYNIWMQEHGVKRASNMMFGIMISVVLCGISGDWKTLLRNGIVQLGSLVVSAGLSRKDIVTLEIKGDDVDLESSRAIQVESAVARFSLIFNLASKFNTNDVRYFCKAFRVKVCGRWLEIADPWARVQSLCTPVWIDGPSVDMGERWVSLCADLRHYDNGLALDAVAEATKLYYGLKAAPIGLCRALSMIKEDKKVYMNFFMPPELAC